MKRWRCVWLLLAAGCISTGTARTGRVAEAGKFAANAAIVTVSFAPGEVDFERKDASRTQLRGNTSPQLPLLNPLMALGMYEFGVRIGVGKGCEAGLIAGWTRLGGEARCSVLREERAPLSAAVSVAGGYAPLARGPWVRTGIDASRDVGSVTPLGGLYLSYGTQAHSFLTEEHLDPADRGPGHFPDFARMFRNEVRLAATLGARFTPSGASVGPYLAVEPYSILWADGLRDEPCDRCALVPRSLRERFGVSAVVGVDH